MTGHLIIKLYKIYNIVISSNFPFPVKKVLNESNKFFVNRKTRF
jgi:hypothetical protein